MKHLRVTLFVFFVLVSSAAAQSVSPKDLKMLEGGPWIGELTYLD